MKIVLQRSYRSKNGNSTFVYTVTGSADDIAAYKKAQGDFYREDDNNVPLWFTTRCVGPRGSLIITSKGNIVADMSAFDQAASIASQYGGNFGQELAKASVALILGTNVPEEAPEAPTSKPEAEKASSKKKPATDELG